MERMRDAGHWALSTDILGRGEGIGVFPMALTVVSLGSTEHRTFPPLLAELKLFASTSEAKKNGWNRPLEGGDHLFKKKTYVLRIIP